MTPADVLREFARLATIGYTNAPWSAADIPDEARGPLAREAALEWAEILRPATAAQLTHAVRAWAARDCGGWWPKPGQVRACLPSPSGAVAMIATCPDDPAFEHVREAERSWTIGEALWYGAAPEEAWPELDGSVPAVRDALARLAGRGWCNYDAATALRYAAACRRLLGMQALLEQHGAPEASRPQIMADAVAEAGLYSPAATREGVRAWVARRVAEDQACREREALAWRDALALEAR